MIKKNELKDLQKFALDIRIGTLTALGARGFGHVGGSLSIADALAVLYGREMTFDPQNPKLENRDKLVCSKGHAGPAIYATLALKGFFSYDELKTLNQPGTNFPSHCDRNKTPGIDMTTGSLGQGTSLAVGMALGDKLKGRNNRVFLIVGDGELDEGQAWEAFSFAAAKKVTNLVVLIDNNKKQLDGYVRDVLDTGNLRLKMEAFGFHSVKIDGNDITQLADALEETRKECEAPWAIVLDTVKGKGVTEVEETMSNHSMNVPAEKWMEWKKGLEEERAAMDGEAQE